MAFPPSLSINLFGMSESGESLLSILFGTVSSTDRFAKLKTKVLAGKRMAARIRKFEGLPGEPEPNRYIPSLETAKAILRSSGVTPSVISAFLGNYPNCLMELLTDHEVKFTESTVMEEMRGFSSNVSLSEPKGCRILQRHSSEREEILSDDALAKKAGKILADSGDDHDVKVILGSA